MMELAYMILIGQEVRDNMSRNSNHHSELWFKLLLFPLLSFYPSMLHVQVALSQRSCRLFYSILRDRALP